MRCTGNKDKESAGRVLEETPSMYSEREWIRICAKEEKEKRKQRKLFFSALCLTLLTGLLLFLVYYFVFRSHDYTLSASYSLTDTVLGAGSSILPENTADSFAQDLCVASGDVNSSAVSLNAYSAAVFDLNNQETLYAKDIFTRRSPASITKIMTALVTLKYGNLDDTVTVSTVVEDIEYGSSVCDIKEGDVLTLRQLLYGMMVASGNDAAMAIAEHVAGSVSDFVALMNQEAQEIGATDTHFTNPHGLNDSEHYTTVYDIYLIMNAALQYDIFQDIISRKNFYAEYTHMDGSAVAVTWESTNRYFTSQAEAPDGIVVCGGKTGTTEDAGSCLALLSKDLYGNPYISIILHASDKDGLYSEMNSLLQLILTQ